MSKCIRLFKGTSQPGAIWFNERNPLFSAKLRLLTFTEPHLKRYRISNNDQVIEYEVVHRPTVTRRIHLELSDNGALQVVAPRRMSKRGIHAALQQRAPYVARFLVGAIQQQKDIPKFVYINGEQHLFMGHWYPLNIQESPGKRTRVELIDEKIQIVTPGTDSESIRNSLTGWYRQQAGKYFSERLSAFSQVAAWTGGKPPVMRLRLMKRTWGSCSSKGVITLNPHLVKAPLESIDYVVAHEICHLREHNHGRAFYALQEQLYPGWREAKAHLGSRGHVYLHV